MQTYIKKMKMHLIYKQKNSLHRTVGPFFWFEWCKEGFLCFLNIFFSIARKAIIFGSTKQILKKKLGYLIKKIAKLQQIITIGRRFLWHFYTLTSDLSFFNHEKIIFFKNMLRNIFFLFCVIKEKFVPLHPLSWIQSLCLKKTNTHWDKYPTLRRVGYFRF